MEQHFNSYKEGLDLRFLRDYCTANGRLMTFERGATLETAGQPSQWIGYVVRGCFKYTVQRPAPTQAPAKTGKELGGGTNGHHRLCVRGRIRGRLPELPQRTAVGSDNRGRRGIGDLRH